MDQSKFKASDFGFIDADRGVLSAIKIAAPPNEGVLKMDGRVVKFADIIKISELYQDFRALQADVEATRRQQRRKDGDDRVSQIFCAGTAAARDRPGPSSW